MKRVFTSLVSICACLSLLAPALRGAYFMRLGDLPDGNFESAAYAVSADGFTVVGYGASATSAVSAMRWTSASGMTDLGLIPGNPENRAEGVSGDGSVVVGYGCCGNGGGPWRWTQATGFVPLGTVGEATATSRDGSVVVGQGAGTSANGQAVRWTQSGGTQELGYVSGYSGSNATAVSADGNVVVGNACCNQNAEITAFRWTSSTGMQSLGDLPGGINRSWGVAVSADGSTIVGESDGANGPEAYRWTQATGMVGLGIVHRSFDNAGGNTHATAVSGNGSVILGSVTYFDRFGNSAFIWDAVHGFRDLATVLVNDYGLGAQLGSFYITEPRGISSDGRTMVGIGINPEGHNEAWLAYIGLNGDYTGDNRVDARDYVRWRRGSGSVFSQNDYSLWRSNFGSVSSAAVGAETTNVPETSSFSLVAVSLCVLIVRPTGKRLSKY